MARIVKVVTMGVSCCAGDSNLLLKSFINRDHPSPPHEYRSFSGEENPIDENCIICLERLSGIRELRMLTCGHMFHDHCITTALNQRRQCPICRIAS